MGMSATFTHLMWAVTALTRVDQVVACAFSLPL